MESILTNEKYKGDALLQKRFTTDFLTKKMKVNEGEVPQYYVENSYPAIISPEEFDAVQTEFQRRKSLGRRYSGRVFSPPELCAANAATTTVQKLGIPTANIAVQFGNATANLRTRNTAKPLPWTKTM